MERPDGGDEAGYVPAYDVRHKEVEISGGGSSKKSYIDGIIQKQG